MKKQMTTKRLVLKKQTLAHLNNVEMGKLVGGDPVDSMMCQSELIPCTEKGICPDVKVDSKRVC